LQKDIAKTSLKTAFGSYLPNVFVQGNKLHNNRYSPSARNDEKWEDTWNVVGVASLTLFDGLDRESKVEEARDNIEHLEIMEAQIKDNLELQIRHNFMQLQETIAIRTSTLTNVDLAERSLKMANDQYVAGQLNSIDVLNTQLMLNQAKNSLAKAFYNHEIIVVQIQNNIGDDK
jgi:outer membrane protein TolC